MIQFELRPGGELSNPRVAADVKSGCDSRGSLADSRSVLAIPGEHSQLLEPGPKLALELPDKSSLRGRRFGSPEHCRFKQMAEIQ